MKIFIAFVIFLASIIGAANASAKCGPPAEECLCLTGDTYVAERTEGTTYAIVEALRGGAEGCELEPGDELELDGERFGARVVVALECEGEPRPIDDHLNLEEGAALCAWESPRTEVAEALRLNTMEEARCQQVIRSRYPTSCDDTPDTGCSSTPDARLGPWWVVFVLVAGVRWARRA